MSDHIPDVTKMISNTPRTNNYDWSFHLLFAEAQKMERELNAANERIRLLIAERDTARLQADRNYKLREEFVELLGTDDVERGVAVVREMKERIKRLEEWKESAMAVEREWNPNSLSKMLGGQLGESQRVVIMREVPKLKERINQLKEALGLVVPHCSWVHHSKKHQHKYGEPCPVVALIEKAKEAKP